MRRRPRYTRWIGTGVVLGFVAGMVVATITPDLPVGYSQSSAIGALGASFGLLGGMLAALVAVLLDPTPRPDKASRRS